MKNALILCLLAVCLLPVHAQNQPAKSAAVQSTGQPAQNRKTVANQPAKPVLKQQAGQSATRAAQPATLKKVEVVYFHYSRRCVTCQTVERESLNALKELFPSQLKKGQITFRSVNLDEESSKTLAERCKAEGQSLLIISGTKRTDLTDQAFMYAKSQPEKLREILRKTVEQAIR